MLLIYDVIWWKWNFLVGLVQIGWLWVYLLLTSLASQKFKVVGKKFCLLLWKFLLLCDSWLRFRFVWWSDLVICWELDLKIRILFHIYSVDSRNFVDINLPYSVLIGNTGVASWSASRIYHHMFFPLIPQSVVMLWFFNSILYMPCH